MTEAKTILPKTVGVWTSPDAPRIVNAETIFDYIDGAGELYLGYRFDHLEVYEYKAQSQKDILVELYFFETSDDAFGLLSLDWGGEAVDLSQTHMEQSESDEQNWPRALYGEGLLRIWSDNLYARVMAYIDTPESEQAVLDLGRGIIEGRENPPRPKLLGKLPDFFQPEWTPRLDRASYFRTHLVLNSLYFLSQENILDLDLTSEGISVPYERMDSSGDQERIQFLMMKYIDLGQAQKALVKFHEAYLPEHSSPKLSSSSGKVLNAFRVEDGWLGYKLEKNSLALIFGCPDQETARTVIDQIR